MPRVDSRELAAIFAGGALGALLRSGLVQAAGADPGHWPWVTLGVNVAGAFLLGAVAAALETRPGASAYWHPLLSVGLCGALTTFSTLQLELLEMLDRHAYGLAAGYVSAGVVAGLAAVALGGRLARSGRVAA
jgi:CrcB protein